MDHFNRFRQYLAINIILAIFLPGLVGIGIYIWLREGLGFDLLPAAMTSTGLYIFGTCLSYYALMKTSTGPLQMVWQAIWHVSPGKSDVPPPKLDEIKVKAARELVTAMVRQVYDLAGNKPILPGQQTTASQPVTTVKIDSAGLLESVPLPMLILDKSWNVRAANQAVMNYTGLTTDAVVGKNINEVLHISFKTDDTLDNWLKETSSKATDLKSWEQVRLDLADGSSRQFDLAASYSRDNSSGNEAVLALFDRTAAYGKEEKATSFVAMAVHELRTPLTLLRGYVEMFDDELGPTLSAEHQEFMRKMSASAQNLTAFVNNILNASRVDENQFVVKLHEADWGQVLPEIISDLELRAQVRGKKLNLHIDEGLPKVAIDRLAMYEVVSNLVENAIKYSGQSTDINISVVLGNEGMIETTVEDHGTGIPDNVIGQLFTKYYRSHRSKNAVSGNGLGLFLVKAIVTAHGGNVWVNSKEGEGSRFTFSLQPYDKVKDQSAGQSDIEHQAGGWIKNHSFYRR